MDIIETGGESMNRTTRPEERRRIARVRRETLRVLDAAELHGVLGRGAVHVVVLRDDTTKVIDEDQRGPSRYCVE